jgi:bifunctional non-homologous end joining protein LigD
MKERNLAKRTPFPRDVKPMLATLVDQPFDNPDWIYEIKWDGYRVIAYLNRGRVEIRSRNNLSFNEKFNVIKDALEQWDIKAVLDGEIVALDEQGRPDFQQLQNVLKHKDTAHLVYYIFDILWYDGKDLTQLPLMERKEILKSIFPDPGKNDRLRYSDHIVGKGIEFLSSAVKHGLEGVMAKKGDSIYEVGARSGNWLKMKNSHRMEAIIAGFTLPRRSRKFFGAVILGRYEGKKLVYIGHSGSGFNDKDLKSLWQRFQPLIIDKCPFERIPPTNQPAVWLRPQLVCEVKFSEWTKDKILRHPIFAGLREDKNASTEKNVKMVSVPKNTEKRQTTKKAVNRNLLLPDDSPKEQIIKVGRRELKLTNLNKVYWPKEKYTKRDLLNYYHEIAPYILPYMLDRPQSLNRHPNGIASANFYQKNTAGKVADWITTYRFDSESQGPIDFLVCTDEATLLYMASLGCIEMNPWHSRTAAPHNPDWCVIDLDPDGNPYEQVMSVALVIKGLLDEMKIPAWCKTSGATGMHIYIPLKAKYTYDQSRMLARLIVDMAHQDQRIASFTSLERTPAKRKKKIYLDFLQNREIQTLAAPYSVRPKPGATVSTPLHWDELKKGLKPSNFTMLNIFDRLKREGDLFKPVLGKGIDLEKAIRRMESMQQA